MDNKIDVNRLGLTFAIFMAVLHAFWAICVAVGIGQTYLNWIFPLHFVSGIFSVTTFSFWGALLLIVVAFIAGYVCGVILAAIWNILRKKR